jgi:hypothetical protein
MVLVQVSGAGAGDWARFRGPNGSGISSDDKPTPVTWSETENLKWKVALPGPGHSSPIVVGDRVFVTCWTGYGTDLSQDEGNQADLKRHLLCIDRHSGAILWDKAIEADLPEDNYGGNFAQHGYASHTPVSDGQRVYVFFGKTGVLAFDMDGNQLWKKNVGTELDRRRWGSASSPILHENLVIVTAAAESQSLVALDKVTGEEVWKAEADGLAGTWGTPILVEVDGNRTDIVLAVPYEMWGFNPDSGKLRWYCEALSANYICSSVIAHDGIVYAMESGPGGGGAIAVRASGKGDVTATNVVWTSQGRSRITSPVYHDRRLYWVSGRVANAIDASTGEQVYQSRLTGGAAPSAPDPGRGGPGGPGRRGGGFGGRGGQDYSSPVVADGKLYYFCRNGDAYVLELGTELKQLAVNRFESDNGAFSSTPAISNGELFIRSTKNLYCVAEK